MRDNTDMIRRQLELLGYADLANNKRVLNAIADLFDYVECLVHEQTAVISKEYGIFNKAHKS